jgi:hypothetical protein
MHPTDHSEINLGIDNTNVLEDPPKYLDIKHHSSK